MVPGSPPARRRAGVAKAAETVSAMVAPAAPQGRPASTVVARHGCAEEEGPTTLRGARSGSPPHGADRTAGVRAPATVPWGHPWLATAAGPLGPCRRPLRGLRGRLPDPHGRLRGPAQADRALERREVRRRRTADPVEVDGHPAVHDRVPAERPGRLARRTAPSPPRRPRRARRRWGNGTRSRSLARSVVLVDRPCRAGRPWHGRWAASRSAGRSSGPARRARSAMASRTHPSRRRSGAPSSRSNRSMKRDLVGAARRPGRAGAPRSRDRRCPARRSGHRPASSAGAARRGGRTPSAGPAGRSSPMTIPGSVGSRPSGSSRSARQAALPARSAARVARGLELVRGRVPDVGVEAVEDADEAVALGPQGRVEAESEGRGERLRRRSPG